VASYTQIAVEKNHALRILTENRTRRADPEAGGVRAVETGQRKKGKESGGDGSPFIMGHLAEGDLTPVKIVLVLACDHAGHAA